jgi:hypothetical protein
MNLLAKKALDTYGGKELWTESKRIEAEVSVHGLAFTLKRRPFFKYAKIAMDIARPYSRLTPIGKEAGITGVLDGQDVRLEDQHGKVIRERKDARAYFPAGRRLLYWDDLDMAYFANYAFWNYFTLPALLLREEILWKENTPGCFEANFPNEIPTHNLIQRFCFDEKTGQLIQHDYTAEIISNLAKAANVVLEHARNDEGILYTSKRLVTPRSPKGKALPAPTLIAITVHDFCFIK